MMAKLQLAFQTEFQAASASQVRSGDTVTPRFMYNHWLLDAHSSKGFKAVSRL